MSDDRDRALQDMLDATDRVLDVLDVDDELRPALLKIGRALRTIVGRPMLEVRS
jgi:hypothetical protein